jgi:hypothetical protein
MCAFMVWSWCDRLHSWYGVYVTVCIHRVDAIWHAAGVIPQSHSVWFLCTLYSVHCRVVIHLADF